MKNKQGIQLAFNLRHQYGQQFMTFAQIFIANGIDKIHTLSNESALLVGKGGRGVRSGCKFVVSKSFSEMSICHLAFVKSQESRMMIPIA